MQFPLKIPLRGIDVILMGTKIRRMMDIFGKVSTK